MLSAASHNVDDYESLLMALQNVLGIIVSDVQRRYLVEKIEPLLLSFKFDSLSLLVEKLQARDADVCSNVLDVISQRQPDWFLSDETKSILHKYIFAQLSDNAKIWIAGCGQGQLAYSVMMEIAKYEHKQCKYKDFQLIATDVLASDISYAEQAIYDSYQLSTLRDEDKKRFFKIDEKVGSGQVKDKFRQKITFSQCALIDDFQSLGKMDLIICPEVLVYFSNGVKAGIIKQFSDLLNSGGILLTGNNQAVTPFTDSFEFVEHPAGVFYRHKI